MWKGGFFGLSGLLMAAAASLAQGDKPTEMYYRVHPLVKDLEHADAAKDDKKAEELAREILKLPMEPAEQKYLTAQLFTPMLWLRKRHRLEAWLADTEKDLQAMPDAAHLLWFYSLGWEYQNRFKLKADVVEVARARSPVWLRIGRKGAVWTAGMSQDGQTWTEISVPDWNTEKTCVAGIASAIIPPKEGSVPAAFHEPAFEPATSVKGGWSFEKSLASASGVEPKPDPAVSLDAHSEAFRMDALTDAGWLLQRSVEGDFTLTTKLEYQSKFWEGGIRVAMGSGHFAPRIYMSLDRDGVVRCQVRHQDTRGVMAMFRLARLRPAVAWVQIDAAGGLSSLGLNGEAIPFFERVMDHDFAEALSGHYSPLLNSYFRAGKEDDLMQRFLDWQPPPEVVVADKVPFSAYTTMARVFGEAGKWRQSLAVAQRGMALCKDKFNYQYRRLALQAVNGLEGMDRKQEISAVILDALVGQAPPHWNNTSGQAGGDGPWNESIGLLYAAVKHGCGGDVWRKIQKVVPEGATAELDRMDRVLAGIAAHDEKILPEWRELIEYLKQHGAGVGYFHAGAGHMLEEWKGHEREAMETWLEAAQIGSRARHSVHMWDPDLPMAEGAVRCALKLNDLETARQVIVCLNERFDAGRATILEKTDWSSPGVRILQNAVDQKHPEIAALFLETMDAIVTHAVQPEPRANHGWLEKIKGSLAESK